MNGSPTDDSPLSLPRTRLTVANPDMIDSEAESTSPGKSAEAAERRNRALPPNPPMSPPPVPVPMQELVTKRESVKPLVVKKDRSRTPSPVKPNVSMSGRESPVKKSGRESPTKRSGKERGREREPRREHSPVKRRTEPLKDHSAMNGDSQKPRVPFEALRNGEAEMGSPGASLRTSMMANGSTTSVDAIQGDDDVEFGVKEKDSNGRVLRRSRASMDSIGKIHVITPKTSLQKIRVRVVSNPAPIEVTKETSPVKEDAPDLVSSPESMDVSVTADSRSSSLGEPIAQPTRSKSRPRSGYTGGESKHSIYGTASNVSVDDYSEDAGSPRSSVMGPRPRIPIAEFETPLAPPVIPARTGSRASPHMTPDMRAQMQPKLAESSAVTPYMTPTDEHGPLHPFSEKPIEYRNLMPSIAPISVMRVEAAMPPLKGDAFAKLRASPENLKGAFMDPLFDLPPPKAPFMNEAFSVSKEKLAAQSEFKKASQSHKRESTTESERDRRRAKEEREEERVRARERAERVERHERDRAERAERERLDRERLERERAERERAELERIELERAERERVQRAEKERLDRERVEWERAVERARAEQARVEQARAEQERLEWERAEEQQRLERERLRAEKEQADRERQERHRLAQLKKEQDREREREQQRLKDLERQAREREFERLEMERLERERLEREQERIDRERLERIRAEQERLEWERQEYERMERERLEEELRQRERLEEELRQRERENSQPPPLIHSRQSSGGGSRRRHEYDGEREVHVVTMKEARKASKRRGTPGQSRSTSPTSTVPPPPPPKDDRMFKTRQRSRTDTSTHNIPHTVSPPPIEVLGGVPVLPQGTHIEVAPTYARASSEEATDLSTLKAREAWERERLDKGQSVLGPGVQRAVIPDPSSPRPTPDPRQRPPTSNGRSLTTPNPIGHTESYILPPVQIHPSASANMLPSEYGPTHASYAQPSYPQPIPAPRSHNPLPKPPTISGPVPLHSRPGPAYTNPNRQRPSATRNPLPVPPRVSPYPMHHNVSPPRGHPPGAVDARAPGRWETMPS
ncbi:hypothetical protein FS749_015441 [Ceratobasidium sp. UAMH 11750]|nr:hypothetical protein FS749_015441 [Ceratobasidium sp. UAMH 11750]